jgi:hypothetical protein
MKCKWAKKNVVKKIVCCIIGNCRIHIYIYIYINIIFTCDEKLKMFSFYFEWKP